MKEKILNFLKTNAKLKGVQESYLLEVADHYAKSVTEESQIATTLTDGVVDFIKLNADQLQKEGDKRVNQARLDLKTWQKEHGLDENGKPISPKDPKEPKDPKDPKDPADPSDIKKIISDAITAAVQPLQQKIEKQEQEKLQSALAEKVKGHEKIKAIPAWFLKKSNLVPESEDKIDQLVADIESDWNTTRQQMAEEGMVVSIPPAAGGGGSKDGAEAGKRIAEKHNAQVTGKQTQGAKPL